MKFRLYPEYKNSGVEWIGEIPKNWEIRSLKNIYIFEKVKILKNSLKNIQIPEKVNIQFTVVKRITMELWD